jgi:hypothetical protein
MHKPTMNKQFAATMMMIAVVMVATTTVVVGMTIVLQNVEAHTCVDNSASGKSHCSNSKNNNHKDLDVPGNPRN